MKKITTFPHIEELEKAILKLEELQLPYEVIIPEPAYEKVGLPAIVLDKKSFSSFMSDPEKSIIFSGWIDYRQSSFLVPESSPNDFGDDIFGKASIIVLSPCFADEKKIRLVSHITGNIIEVLPYLNTIKTNASYNKDGKLLTYIDNGKMIVLYPRKITIAKADDIIDAWRILEEIRCKVNFTWQKRNEIKPLYEMRKRPAALEIYSRLPGINCSLCGEKTCLAFAIRLWAGETKPSLCEPIFKGEYSRFKNAFLDICTGFGVME